MSDFDYTSLDPGIRCVVRLLHRWGYETAIKPTPDMRGNIYRDLVITGSSVSSAAAGLRRGHAYMLLLQLIDAGVGLKTLKHDGASIQYERRRGQVGATIIVFGLSDDDLPDELRAELEAELVGLGGAPCAPCNAPLDEEGYCAACREENDAWGLAQIEDAKARSPKAAELFKALASAAGDAFDDVDAVAFVDELRGRDVEGDGDE